MDRIKLEIVCDNMVIPGRERYIEFDELLTKKSLVIKDFIKDVQATLEMSDDVEHDILSNFDKMSYKIISHDGELLVADSILIELVSSLRYGLLKWIAKFGLYFNDA